MTPPTLADAMKASAACQPERRGKLLPSLHIGMPREQWQSAQDVIEQLEVFNESNHSSALHTSKHIFSAAYPRLSRRSTTRPGHHSEASTSAKGEDWMASMYAASADPGLFEGWNQLDTEPQLWMSAQRWKPTRTSSPHGMKNRVTLVLIHASGMHKEIWTPFVEDLLSTPGSADHVEEVWALDSVITGTAGVLNRNCLGDTYHWADNARDIAEFTQHFLPHDAALDPPAVLHRDEARSTRKVVGIGHSSGAAALVRAAISSTPPARLFDSIILLDPIIASRNTDRGPLIHHMVRGCSRRRDVWSSIAEVAETYARKAPFKDWDERVFESHLADGFYTSEDGSVHLCCDVRSEAANYIDWADVQEAWDDLTSLKHESVRGLPISFIFATKAMMMHPGGVAEQDELVRQCRAVSVLEGAASQSVRMVRIDAGHFIPMEEPSELARLLWREFLSPAVKNAGSLNAGSVAHGQFSRGDSRL